MSTLEFKGNASKASIIEAYEAKIAEILVEKDAQQVGDTNLKTENDELKITVDNLKLRISELEEGLKNASEKPNEDPQDTQDVLGYIGIIKGKGGRWTARTDVEDNQESVEARLKAFNFESKVVEVK